MKTTQHLLSPYLEMGSGFLLGLSLGYALKKSFRGILLIMGFGMIFMFVLESQETITVGQIPLQDFFDQKAEWLQATYTMLSNRLSEYRVGSVGALAGFAVGIKTG